VDIIRAYSKRSDLQEDLNRVLLRLERAAKEPGHARRSVSSTGQVDRAWRTSDRLTADDEAEIVRCFMTGTPKATLAEKHGISESSVKRLLRRHGARRTSWADTVVDVPFEGTDEFGSKEEREAVEALEREIETKLPPKSGVDGHEFGDGTSTIYIYGPSADKIYSAVEPTLKKSPFTHINIALQYGHPDDPATKDKKFSL
jgi:hypothetical protein